MPNGTEDIDKILVTWAKAVVKRGIPIGKDNSLHLRMADRERDSRVAF